MFAALRSTEPVSSLEPLLEAARTFSPRVDATASDTVVLDLHGLSRAWPDPTALGTALVRAAAARGVTVSAALACTRVAALVLARATSGVAVVPRGAERATLAPLPLSVLDLDEPRAALFARWGVRTLGDLAALPPVGLSERLGLDGARLQRLARGEDDAPLVPATPAPTFSAHLDVDWPVEGLEPLSFLLARVLEPLCRNLVQRGRRAASVTLALGLVDGRVHRRTLKPAAPTAEARTWRTLLLLDLEQHRPGDAVRSIAVEAEPTPSRAVQFSLLDPAQPSPEKLAETVGRLHEWTSAGRGGSPVLLDTHRPGAFLLQTFAPAPFRPTGPKGPTPLRTALRAFRPPRPARVAVDGEGPVFVAASGVRGPVTDRAGPWLASGDWWDAAWSREEWDVALGGGVYRVYRDRLRGGWFVEGEVD